jgi:hypothetical protein
MTNRNTESVCTDQSKYPDPPEADFGWFETDDGLSIIYDRENHNAWIRSDETHDITR